MTSMQEQNVDTVGVLPSQDLDRALSSGHAASLVQAIVEVLCPRLASNSRVLFVNDVMQFAVAAPESNLEKQIVARLEQCDAKPDLVLLSPDCLFVVDTCQLNGPINDSRLRVLQGIFSGLEVPSRFITCFESRRAMANYYPQLAWNTDAWCADEPNGIVKLQTAPVTR